MTSAGAKESVSPILSDALIEKQINFPSEGLPQVPQLPLAGKNFPVLCVFKGYFIFYSTHPGASNDARSKPGFIN